MLERFAKLACRSAQLRRAVIEKRAASPLGGVGKAMMLGMGGLTAVTGVKGAVGKYRENKAGFDPAVQQVMLGKPPTPPGA